MSYDSWLEGTLALDPFPDEAQKATLRAELASAHSPAAGRLSLTPLGHGLVCEGAVDWEAALGAIEAARASIFRPAGLELLGTLRALGEDGAHLATVTVNAGGVAVEHHELDGSGEEDLSLEDWIAMLDDPDPEVQQDAVEALADYDDEAAVEALRRYHGED